MVCECGNSEKNLKEKEAEKKHAEWKKERMIVALEDEYAENGMKKKKLQRVKNTNSFWLLCIVYTNRER